MVSPKHRASLRFGHAVVSVGHAGGYLASATTATTATRERPAPHRTETAERAECTADASEKVRHALPLRHRRASLRLPDCAKLAHDALRALLAVACGAKRALLPHACEAAELRHLLLNELREHRGAELRKRRLRVAAAKSARRACILQDGFFALLHHRLKLWRRFELRDRSLLRFGPTEAKERLLRAKRALPRLHVRREQALHLGLLATLLGDRSLRRFALGAGSLFGCTLLRKVAAYAADD
jgi:hypothetical protein